VVCVYVKLANGDAAGLGELIGLHQRYGLFLDPEGETGALLDQMAHIGNDYGEGGFWRAYSTFSLLIARLQESKPVQAGLRRIIPRAPAPAPSALVQAMDRYLAENFARRVTLAGMARALGVSVSLLTHRIRKETGEPPLQRLLRLRLQRAKIFIAAGQPLKVVAETTGFYDAFHLSHTFKQAEGVSPREFLKQFYGKDRARDIPGARPAPPDRPDGSQRFP
jgi:AraC-like DNA-binding protein